MEGTKILIRALKYGDRKHYEWQTTLLEQTDDYIIVKGEPGRVLHHFTKDKQFTMDNWSVEFFPFDKWFTVSVDIRNGEVEGYYCNVAQPAQFDCQVVSFVDLDLDLIQDGGVWSVVDQDDFLENQVKFCYPESLIKEIEARLEELRMLITRKEFPFDGFMEKYISEILKESKHEKK